jgi:DNA (cytosine-5)-methyltransferase 1
MALRNLGADFETWRVVEFDKYAVASYNAIHGTDYPAIDINDVSAEDLGIVDREHFTYLLTYSFPCTDLSIAGRMAGMSEDSGTRSSLLWQVKRILTECQDNLPQILVMENVPAIHNGQNMPDFRKWLDFLESLGYSSYMQDLNAWDFNLAQSRERTFVVSLLGDYNYKFPEIIDDLDFCIEDYFEDLTEEQALQLVVKSEKALDLLVKLDDEGKLE